MNFFLFCLKKQYNFYLSKLKLYEHSGFDLKTNNLCVQLPVEIVGM